MRRAVYKQYCGVFKLAVSAIIAVKVEQAKLVMITFNPTEGTGGFTVKHLT
jgi:hypothetical protein